MKDQKYLLISIPLLLLSSCQNLPDPVIAKNTIDISKSLDQKDFLNLSEIASEIEYIQLETDSSCFINRLDNLSENIQFTKDRIFIADKDQILGFNSKGKFIAHYGRKGKGPAEYMRPGGFTVLEDLRQIAVLCQGLQKVIFFDYEGKFIKGFKIDFWPTKMVYFNNNLVFINPLGRRFYTDYYIMSVIDLNGKLQNKFMFREIEKQIEKNDKIKISTRNICRVESDTMIYWEPYENIIWKIPTDFSLIPQYSIKYIPKGEKTDHFDYMLESKNKKIDLDYFWEHVTIDPVPLLTNRFLFIKINKKGFGRRVLYDKTTKKIFTFRFSKPLGSIQFI